MCGYVPGVHDAEPQNLALERLRTKSRDSRVLLAIDTAIGTSVALAVGERVYEASSDDPRGHTEVIGGLIARVFDEALQSSGVTPDAVDAVVVGIGPGPFTGLRVGIAAAKAFATGRRVPLLPLQGHEAVAFEQLTAGSAGSGSESRSAIQPGVRVLQDAKRRELFVTEYSGIDWLGLPVRTVDAHLMPRAEYVEEPRDVWPERIPAARLLQLAMTRLDVRRDFEPEAALYLRSPDVKPAAAIKRVSTSG